MMDSQEKSLDKKISIDRRNFLSLLSLVCSSFFLRFESVHAIIGSRMRKSRRANSASSLYVDDVFSTYLYNGNGTSRTITNGIDLAGNGGMVWCKSRNVGADHHIFDTIRGVNNRLRSNSTASVQTTTDTLTSYGATGFTLGADSGFTGVNVSDQMVSWTFRKAPKFFDCGTYTGNGVAGRQIPHSLGVVPGIVIFKNTSSNIGWYVYHHNMGLNGGLVLNTTSVDSGFSGLTAISDTNLSLMGNDQAVNGIGASYLWYAFAHDATTDGIIQCGSFTSDSSGNATVNLGWEPQYLMLKKASGAADQWYVVDQMRGWGQVNWNFLGPNNSTAEYTTANVPGNQPTATGFVTNSNVTAASSTYIYMAIRRPNKPPTLGTQVYNAIARTGTGATATVTGVGFAPDLIMSKYRNSAGTDGVFLDRLRGPIAGLFPTWSGAETSIPTNGLTTIDIDGFTAPSTSGYFNNSGTTFINHFFKRAVGVFDIVCTSTGNTTNDRISHNLGVPPELIIHKCRGIASQWTVGHPASGLDKSLYFTSAASTSFTPTWTDVNPTSFGFNSNGFVGASGITEVFYLFATKAGISKVGSFTGNGSSQTIDMGFSTGARFFLVKATSTTGNWWVYDSIRGVVAGSDPALTLNSSSIEVTSADAVDPASVGLIVNQEATCSINANGVSYIYLAYA